jgi:hypothetical protein
VLGFGKRLDDPIEQVAGATSVIRRDGDRVPEPQLVELDRGVAAGQTIGFVRDQNRRFVGSPQHVGDFMVARVDATARVDHEHDNVGLADGDVGLLARVVGNLGERSGFDFLIVLQSAGVDQGELDSAPVRRAVDAVASRSRLVFDDGAPFADQAVEQRGLADVRPADDCDDRFCHWRSANTARRVQGGSTPALPPRPRPEGRNA